MNRLMKYSCLPRSKKLTLSNITAKLVEEFIPSLHYKYVFKNFKQTTLNRSYNPSVVPRYLQDRPRGTILHCLDRKASANKYDEANVCDVNTEIGCFVVCSKDNKYTVNFGVSTGSPSCSCKDWKAHHLPCKHFFAVFKFRDKWTWNALPHQYLESEYVSVDQEAVASYCGKSSAIEEGFSLSTSIQDAHCSIDYTSELPVNKVLLLVSSIMALLC